jgi:hypothetical protein
MRDVAKDIEQHEGRAEVIPRINSLNAITIAPPVSQCARRSNLDVDGQIVPNDNVARPRHCG